MVSIRNPIASPIGVLLADSPGGMRNHMTGDGESHQDTVISPHSTNLIHGTLPRGSAPTTTYAGCTHTPGVTDATPLLLLVNCSKQTLSLLSTEYHIAQPN